MKRKIFAVCMVLALMLTCLFAIPAQAAEEAFVKNGDFSAVANSVPNPADWVCGNSWASIKVNKTAENPYLYFTGKTTLPSADIVVKSGESYTLSLRAYAYDNSIGCRVYWRFYDAAGNALNGDAAYQTYLSLAPGAWKTQANTVTAPENATKLVLVLNCYAYPEALPEGVSAAQMMGFDDVKLTKGTQVLGERVSNSNMETLQDGMPTNFKVTGTAALETTTVHSGTKALKVTGEAADSVTTVSTFFFAEKGTPYYDISAYVNVDAIEEGAGVKMEVYRWKKYMHDNSTNDSVKVSETGYFKASDKGWIKMMPVREKRFALSADAVLEIRVTVEGKGTVYLDDFSANGTNNLLYNGELDGFSADDAFIGLIGTLNYSSISLDPHATASLHTEENGNKYLLVHNCPSSNQGYDFRGMWEIGAKYKFSMDVKNADGYGARIGITNAGVGALGVTPNNGTTWEHYELYFTCDNSKGTGGYTFIHLHTRGAGNEARYDNISLVKVSDAPATTICDANGNAVTEAEAGKAYTAKYFGFAKDYTTTNDEPVTLVFALYEKLEDGSLRLDTIKLAKGTDSYIARVDNYGNAIMKEGQLPIELNASAITIPNDGKSYELRAYTWDDFTNMAPYYASISA